MMCQVIDSTFEGWDAERIEAFLLQIKGRRAKDVVKVRKHLKDRLYRITKNIDLIEELHTRNNFNDWGMEQITEFEVTFHNQRCPAALKDIRTKVAERRRTIERQVSDDKAFSKFLPKFKLLYELMMGLPGAMERTYESKEFAFAQKLAGEYGETVEIVNAAHRILGTTLFDMPVVPLGLDSKECSEALRTNSLFKRVHEHFFPRGTVAGPQLLNFLMSKHADDIENFAVLLFTFCQIVYTTAKENNADLKEHQKFENFTSPKDSYQKAGIELVRTCVYAAPRVWVRLFDYYKLELPEPYDFGAVVVGDHEADINTAITE